MSLWFLDFFFCFKRENVKLGEEGGSGTQEELGDEYDQNVFF